MFCRIKIKHKCKLSANLAEFLYVVLHPRVIVCTLLMFHPLCQYLLVCEVMGLCVS